MCLFYFIVVWLEPSIGHHFNWLSRYVTCVCPVLFHTESIPNTLHLKGILKQSGRTYIKQHTDKLHTVYIRMLGHLQEGSWL